MNIFFFFEHLKNEKISPVREKSGRRSIVLTNVSIAFLYRKV